MVSPHYTITCRDRFGHPTTSLKPFGPAGYETQSHYLWGVLLVSFDHKIGPLNDGWHLLNSVDVRVTKLWDGNISTYMVWAYLDDGHGLQKCVTRCSTRSLTGNLYTNNMVLMCSLEIMSFDSISLHLYSVGRSMPHMKKPVPLMICWHLTPKAASDLITMFFVVQKILSLLLTTKMDMFLFSMLFSSRMSITRQIIKMYETLRPYCKLC